MIVECPECSRQVSDRAAACPGCGYPLRSWWSRAGEVLAPLAIPAVVAAAAAGLFLTMTLLPMERDLTDWDLEGWTAEDIADVRELQWIWRSELPPGWPDADKTWLYSQFHIAWPWVFLEQTLIVLVCGGMIAWLVYRRRRTRAALG